MRAAEVCVLVCAGVVLHELSVLALLSLQLFHASSQRVVTESRVGAAGKCNSHAGDAHADSGGQRSVDASECMLWKLRRNIGDAR